MGWMKEEFEDADENNDGVLNICEFRAINAANESPNRLSSRQIRSRMPRKYKRTGGNPYPYDWCWDLNNPLYMRAEFSDFDFDQGGELSLTEFQMYNHFAHP